MLIKTVIQSIKQPLMDIDRVIQNLREAKKKASCPPGL